jgi:hypothetical protein
LKLLAGPHLSEKPIVLRMDHARKNHGPCAGKRLTK